MNMFRIYFFTRIPSARTVSSTYLPDDSRERKSHVHLERFVTHGKSRERSSEKSRVEMTVRQETVRESVHPKEFIQLADK
jgi:hypothetical protein